MEDTQWVVFFFGIALNCDSPILEALYFVIYRPTSRDVWSRLPDGCTFETLLQEFHDIINSTPHWIAYTSNIQKIGWQIDKAQILCRCLVYATETYLSIIEKRETNGITERFFELGFNKSFKVMTEAIVNNMPVSKGAFANLSLKQQILQMNYILDHKNYQLCFLCYFQKFRLKNKFGY